MLETKIIEIYGSHQQEIIDQMQCFGWHVINSQKIDYTTTYTTGGGNARKGYTFTTHIDKTEYYSITFQRDTNMDNFEIINPLFLEYDGVLSKYKEALKNVPSKTKYFSALSVSIVSLVILLIGFLIWVGSSKDSDGSLYGLSFIITALIFGIPAGIFTFKFRKDLNNAQKRYEENCSTLHAKIEEITAKARMKIK